MEPTPAPADDTRAYEAPAIEKRTSPTEPLIGINTSPVICL